MSIFIESPLGQFSRLITGSKFLKYPEECPDFILPILYSQTSDTEMNSIHSTTEPTTPDTTTPLTDIEKDSIHSIPNIATPSPKLNLKPLKESKAPQSGGSTGNPQEIESQSKKSKTVIEWYSPTDPSNPQNWTFRKRNFVCFVICIYTFTIYAASSIYTSSVEGVIDQFGVTPTEGSLPLSLYVLGYGIGPLIFSPLSEIASIGRSPIYVITFTIFVILSIPTAIVKNFPGLLVLRFLQGFFGSPCLATGGASLQDMYDYNIMPYAIAFWMGACFCGPSLGPLFSGFAVTAEGWRWSLWEIVWGSSPILILMILCLPETSTPNILHRRARRLRLAGNHHLFSQSEIDQQNHKTWVVVLDAMIKPFEITLKDPSIAFVNIYSSLVYGIYYSFFEVFPLVYPPLYGFSTGMIGVVFLCCFVALIIAIILYFSYLYWYLRPDVIKNGPQSQEQKLIPALASCFGPPIGLFLFAWTANPSIHWIASTIGITIYTASVFIVLQCLGVYIPMTYPQVSADLFYPESYEHGERYSLKMKLIHLILFNF